jgi:hypothetical protein
MAQTIVPNQYDLLGPGVTIGYSTSNIAGQPTLSLKKGKQTFSFTGNEITVLDAGIGSLITVTIARTVDTGFTTFSFLLPAINLASATAKQTFQTIGLTTVHRLTIGGPVTGPLETYKSVALKGTARQVVTLTKSVAGS